MIPTFSGDTTALFAALAKAQAEMTSAKKDKANPFFKSKYADLASVLKACRSALNENGLSLTQWPGFDPDRNMVTMHTVIGHAGGGRIECTSAMVPNKSDNQGVGSCQSYLRRYSIQAILAIPAADDDGEAAMGRGGAPVSPPRAKARPKAPAKPKASQAPNKAEEDRGHDPSWAADQKVFFFSIDELGWSYAECVYICGALGSPRPSQLPTERRTRFIRWLRDLTPEDRDDWKKRFKQDVGGAPSPSGGPIF